MKQLLLQIFTWWNGETVGTRFFTWRNGTFVGEDEFGNRYFRASGTALGERRWVVYNGYAEPSRIPPGWHGWIHHTVDVAPSDESFTPLEWQKAHRPNPTGTPSAYRPKGSALSKGNRAKPCGDYEAWSPEA
ncbi:NADH:ubiquinone oxidoreductase subunit NDUFA12 [Terrihabitans sp. B22-R8]|uniref:NADH:ubiquinone oxidoreductase subunit NDUFA12 n=1 Tax=Terrihabitans sp. B22-R8 TaxID=3425128 RepID=UPI00403CBD6A